MCMDKRLLYIPAFADIRKIHVVLDMTIKQLMREAERVVVYEELPEGRNFSDTFSTYILAFCPDTDSWFATNERYFFYEYPMDFPSEEAAIGYFKRNPEAFLKIEKEMNIYRPNFNSGGVYLENIKRLVLVGGGASGRTVDS